MEIKCNIPEGSSGSWSVENFTVSEMDSRISLFRDGMRFVSAGDYTRLMCGYEVVMSNTPAEIRDHMEFMKKCKRLGGSVLINGLGLGIALSEILKYDNIKKIKVIEKSPDVIKLVAPHFKDPRLEIIEGDAFTYKPPIGETYDVVWHDIWAFIRVSNLKEMEKLHRRYGRRSTWQGSWCKELCLERRRKSKAWIRRNCG